MATRCDYKRLELRKDGASASAATPRSIAAIVTVCALESWSRPIVSKRAIVCADGARQIEPESAASRATPQPLNPPPMTLSYRSAGHETFVSASAVRRRQLGEEPANPLDDQVLVVVNRRDMIRFVEPQQAHIVGHDAVDDLVGVGRRHYVIFTPLHN